MKGYSMVRLIAQPMLNEHMCQYHTHTYVQYMMCVHGHYYVCIALLMD